MEVKTNAASELKDAEQLIKIFNILEEKADKIRNQIGFYTIKDVCELTGFSEPTVQAIFNRPDFPVCDYGKRKIVLISAFCDYFSKAVKVSDFS